MVTITHVEVHAPGRLRLTFADGTAGIIDLRQDIERGGVFAPLADVGRFAQVRIGERGRSLEWPKNIDLCADALWQEVRSQSQAA